MLSKLRSTARYLTMAAKFGAPYALAYSRSNTDRELDPEENWEFWTRDRGSFVEMSMRMFPAQRLREALIMEQLKANHADGIEYHYDVSNDFYRLFLDKDYMFYTCANFRSDHETLEQAQKNKADCLLGLLEPEAGHLILDLGCGWGGMLKCIEGHTGTREGLTGYTLSKEQFSYVSNMGYNVALQDFIGSTYPSESLDRVISVGSLEHVHPEELPRLYEKVFNALRPGGRMVNQFFSLDHEPLPYSMLLSQLFFPGSLLAMHDVHCQAAEQAGFEIQADLHDCYKQTLWSWYDNLVANRAEAIATSGIQTYNWFLTFFPIAWKFFDDGEATLHRMLLVKP